MQDLRNRRPLVNHLARPVALAGLAAALLASGAAGWGSTDPIRAGVAAAQAGATPAAGRAQATPIARPPQDPCPDDLTGEGSEPWVRAELFFGTTSPDGTPYSEEEFLDFLDNEITPRFPDGLTVLTGLGQFRDEEGILQERSQVLIILFPAETAAESSALLEEIRAEYEAQFQQQSVLRADAAPVCASF